MLKDFLVKKWDEEIFVEWLQRKRIKFSVKEFDDVWKVFSVEIEFRNKFSKEKILKLWNEGGRSQAEVAKEVGCSASYVQKVVSESE